MDINADTYLTVKEAAALARVHPDTIRDWLRSGVLRGKKFGRKCWRTTKAWLDEMGSQAAPIVRPSQSELEKRAAAAMARIKRKYG
jgi:excisionase family DNA binding protein